MSQQPTTLHFVTAIVKGIKDKNDPYFYFGSLLSFQGHLQQTIKLGLVIRAVDRKIELTEKGLIWYEKANIEKLPDTRAYMWQLDSDELYKILKSI
jgi:hypothetical protein